MKGKHLGLKLTSTALAATMLAATVVYAQASQDTPYRLRIDGENQGVSISQELFGLFFEDINNAADGGLNPELIKNYSFENYKVDMNNPNTGNETSWKLHWTCDQADQFHVVRDAEQGLNENNTNFAQLTGNLTLKNSGFANFDDTNANKAAIAFKEGRPFNFSMWMKADPDYQGTVTIRGVNEAETQDLTDTQTVELVKDGQWHKVTAVLTANATEKGRFVLTVEGAEEDDLLCVDMVSLLPTDTYGYGNKNYGYGAGLRADLVEMLRELDPSFIRFPGGCIVEGNAGLDSYYNWENTIGPLEERKAISNHWAISDTYSYMQSYGLGYHEILQLCEDLDMEPFPILSAGVYCQFSPWGGTDLSDEELVKFAQHATHLIDYCWGSVDSTNPTQAEWAAKRTENGHAEPFNLNYIGIGNENWDTLYLENFDFIKAYIDDYVAENYPGRSITIISSAGPSFNGNWYEMAWNWMNENHPGDTLVDEHYYVSPDVMLTNDDRYDYYQRTDNGGSDVFIGEYAAHVDGRVNNLESALAEAAYLTGVVRNGDIVRHASYAPLFNKVGASGWTPDLIWFDEYDSFATPNYYVQQMYAQNYGEYIIDTNLEIEGQDYTQQTGSPVIGTWSTAGYIDEVTVTDAQGQVLLHETFDDDSPTKDLWESFPGSNGGFTIRDGKLYLDQANELNAVWIPSVIDDPAWQDYRIETVVTKTAGVEGFLVGAAEDASNYYWYNIGGWSNTKTVVERARNGTKSTLGNTFDSKFKPVNLNEPMTVTFNFGVDGKLEAGYTTPTDDSLAHHFSGNLKPYQNDIYQVVSADEDYIYVALVNNEGKVKPVTLEFANLDVDESKAAQVTYLSGDKSAVNSMDNEVISPVYDQLNIRDGSCVYNVPANSFTIIKVARGSQEPEPSAEPSVEPSVAPSVEPTVEPTTEPTVAPTAGPTTKPTAEPSVAPTQMPGNNPQTGDSMSGAWMGSVAVLTLSAAALAGGAIWRKRQR